MTSTNRNESICRPTTARHTASGVDKISPTGPQIHVQNVAEIMTATGVTPVLRPYSRGSSTCPTSGSSTTNKAIVQSTIDQPGSTAMAKAIGNAAARNAPT